MADNAMTTQELRALPEADLRERLGRLRQELWRHRVNATEGSMKQTHLLSRARRDIARVETLLREGAQKKATGQ